MDVMPREDALHGGPRIDGVKPALRIRKFRQINAALVGVAQPRKHRHISHRIMIAAKEAGLKVKINTVAMKGVNEDELENLVAWCGAEGFDLVFIDADKENNAAFVEHAIRLGRPGTVIVVDNAVRSGRILNPAEGDHQARGVREMLELVGAHPRLEAAAIQTVGAKGWDGFVIARVS